MAESDAPAGIPPDFQLVGEHYELTAKLGEGAFGEVYRAHHGLLDQEFAVKILRPELCEDEDVRERFLDEARALIRFSHTNVVQLRHVGEHKNRLYLVMDLVRGRPLDEIIRDEGAFDEQRALAIMRQVLAGLEAAHAAGIIHRDLKPSNLILETRDDGTDIVRILDFGLSKLHAVDGMKSAHRSMTGTIIGTLAYMSPEQLTGSKDIDARSDVFAAGLLLQEMLQGEHPYPGESGIVVAAKLLRDPLPELSKSATVSDSTRAALAGAVERDRDARHRSVTMFAEALAGKGPPSDTSRITTVQDAQRDLARREAAAKKGSRATAEPAAARSRSLMPLLLVLLLGGGAVGAWAAGLFDGGKKDDTTRTAKAPPKDDEPETPTPQPPPKDDRPETPTPQPPPKDDKPETPTPQPPPKDDKPETPTPQPPPKDDKPETPTPQPPPKDDEPETPTPQPPPKDDKPETPTPQPPPKDDEPETPTPQPPPKDDEPETPTPQPPPKDDKPEAPAPTPAASLTPAQCCTQAQAAMTRQAWPEARALFTQALEDGAASREQHLAALRGVAESWFGQVNTQARSGKVADALQSLARAEAFLNARIRAYGHEAKDATAYQRESGFARMHLGEAHTEFARWLNIAGKAEEARKHLKPAADSFEFAHPMLDRDGANYAEFLIRRGALHRLRGQMTPYFKDLEDTTRTNNTEVPKHAWVAHATGARHIAEVFWAKNDLTRARQWAKDAVDIAKKGVAWCEDDFTQEQWLSLIRTLFVAGMLTGPEADPLPLFGLANFWTRLAKKAPVGVTTDARITKARLLEADAVVGYLDGRSQKKRGRDADASKKLTAALGLADEALSHRNAVAAGGGPLPIKYTHQIRTGLLYSLGRADESRQAAQAGAQADRRNPD